MRRTHALLAVLVHAVVCFRAYADPSLWILQPPDKFVEYNVTSFAPLRTVTVPPAALKSPENIAVNRTGQVLFTFPLNVVDVDPPRGDRDIWLYDGHETRTFSSASTTKQPAPDHTTSVTEIKREFFLSADGKSLYTLENAFRRKENENVDLSVVTTYSVRQLDLRGENPKELLSANLPPCECTTGVCSETCPEARVWAPPEGIGDFFLITRWITGQIQTTFEETVLYKRDDGTFKPTPWPKPLESILDATDHGNLLLELIPDAGCCGWINESDDQALLWRSGKSVRIFAERERFRNPNYDISFYPTNGRFSPDRKYAALTIGVDAVPESEMRLADSGKDDPEELARIAKNRKDLPAVEVLRLDSTPVRTALVPHAQFAGWIANDKLLVAVDKKLVIIDTDGKPIMDTRISASNPEWIFVR